MFPIEMLPRLTSNEAFPGEEAGIQATDWDPGTARLQAYSVHETILLPATLCT